ncbi:hypothetical protein IMZ31_23010 (plasmid) [Pontibacillus sp. ALD_SL1]|uniref:hypothetical protein n=1 Tax=Pontibacillus sp. ALD_SL1 TaxID=2777185 RepID=UPI001A97B1DE|nr:hypothetical protein [Pontibacillus sp. ALD_SL1]QST02324.1 hypothetical protein IMZ31_23010 [Pontibacillus sp. ALD_SL1]
MYYERLSQGEKISFVHSMREMIKKFLQSYQYQISAFDSEEALINDMYFYWFRHSVYKDYVWCRELRTTNFDDEFIYETKTLLRFYYCRHKITEERCMHDRIRYTVRRFT